MDLLSQAIVTKQLYLSNPAQSLDRIDPVASADGTTAQSAVLAASQTCTDMIINGQFTNGTTNWGHWNDAGYASTFSVDNTSQLSGANSARVNITSTLGTEWRIQLLQASFAINAGQQYTVYFDAKSSVPRNISVMAQENQSPWNNFMYNGVNLTTTSTTYGPFTFTPTVSHPNVGIFFNLGAQTGTVFIDNVRLLTNCTTSPATTTFTQSPALCSPLTIKAGQPITVTNYVSILSGTMPANPNITAVLKYGSTNLITLNNPSYNTSTGLLTWTGTLGADVTVPAGQSIVLDVTSAQAGVSFRIDYDSQTKPSKINLPVSSYIDINSYAVYDAPYPNGNIITSTATGTTVYPRVVVSDPFGFNDITGLNINISPPGTNVAATSVATSGCTRTYEYVWNTTSLGGTYSIPATAREGLENTVTDVQPLSFNICSPLIGTPVFGLGSTSTRCQGPGTVSYSATSSASTAIAYSLDASSVAAGVTINSATGVVTYPAGWNGSTVITATATGCGGPKIATHTATITPTVGVPVFNNLDTVRCIGAGTSIYAATATNSTAITYSLDAITLFWGNSINASTGAVTFNGFWSGVSTITATATGCNGPSVATQTVSTIRIEAVNDTITGNQGAPIVTNVLVNDRCNINPNSVSIITQPTNGFLQIGTNGRITYLPNGSFVGTDQYTYRVCTPFPAQCDTATVFVNIVEVPDDPCYEASQSKIFYLPFPENSTQLRKALLSAAGINVLTNDVRTIVSFTIPYPGTQIVYDHWEDGYESDITQPIQATTQIWGDGILTNGVAPGFPTDIIPPGGIINLDNTFVYNTRNPLTLAFDGRDKIYSNTDIAISKVSGDAGLTNSGTTQIFEVQAVKTNVFDVSRFGQLFVLPFGEDLTLGGTSAFRYTGVFVRASANGTIVNLDRDGNGTVDVVSPTLNEGEVWFYDGTGSIPGLNPNDVNQANDLRAGAIITSNYPVGVDLVFGGIDNFGTRNMPVLPGNYYGNTYYSPVYSTNTNAPVYAFFTNALNIPLTINWTNGLGGSGTITIPASGSAYMDLNQATGYRFHNPGGQSFTAVAVIDADATGSTYDWSFNMIPEHRLTSFATVAWAPGTSNLSANYNPVWVTPASATTIYIKYNGDVTTGGSVSPCGARYDLAVPLTALQSYLVYDNSDNNQSGIAIYACDDTKLAMVWGQQPFSTTPTANPAIDVGYVLQPKCLAQLLFANDDRATTGQNTPITISVPTNDFGYLVSVDPNSVSLAGMHPPSFGTVQLNPGGSITYTPMPGFTGIDTFEYEICALNYPLVCDRAFVIVDVPCSTNPLQNKISGIVYTDINLSGTQQINEIGTAGYVVQLFNDTDGDGVLDAGEPLVQSQTTTVNGTYEFNLTPPSTTATYRDNFSTAGSPTGTNGTVNWSSSPWIEWVETDGFSNGNVLINSEVLRVQGNGSTVQVGAYRAANLSATTSATLTYTFNKSLFSVATDDWVEVQVATSAFGPWTTLVRYSGTAAQSGSASFNLDNYLSPSTTIRIVESTSNNLSSTEFVTFDNVQIQFPQYQPTNYLVRIQPPLPSGVALSSSPAIYPVNFSGVGDGFCDADFGIKSADVAVLKTVNPATVIAGNNITYQITVTNNGPTYAESVVMNDVLQPGLTLVSTSTSMGTWVSPNWSLGTMEVGQSATMTIVATVAPNTPTGTVISNTATVSSTTPDPNLTNNTSTVNITVICQPVGGVALNSNAQTICSGGSVQLTASVTGFTGTISYMWEYSTDNLNWTSIPGATTTGYTTPALLTNTYYRVLVMQNGGCSLASSSTLITVVSDPVISIYTPSTTICIDGSVVLTAEISGGAGNCTIQWESSLDGTNWTPIPGEHNTTFSTSALQNNMTYRAVYTCDGFGCCD